MASFLQLTSYFVKSKAKVVRFVNCPSASNSFSRAASFKTGHLLNVLLSPFSAFYLARIRCNIVRFLWLFNDLNNTSKPLFVSLRQLMMVILIKSLTLNLPAEI